jgi:uncharacterized protein (TIGR03067 family)
MIDLHPDPRQLAAFRLGTLAEGELAEVERHIADCDSCCQVLRALPDDSFVGLLRRAAPAAADGGTRTWRPGDTAITPDAGVPAALRDHPRYQILDKLGQGGMGVVFKARHRLMDRIVALKILNPGLLHNRASVERFRREVQAAARLVHPNIVTAYDADEAGGLHFLAMEFVSGTSLARLVEEGGRLSVGQACGYARQVALGLQHAAEHGMVHRDVKPQNLMVTADGTVKVLDFGLARFVSEAAEQVTTGDTAGPSSRLTQASTLMGTPEYIAPEQARAAHAADIRADIYSLGCTLYHLLAGRAPFAHGSAEDMVKAHQEQPPRPLTEVRPEVPQALARFVEALMAKDPAGRPQTPAAVAAALAPFVTLPVSSPRRRWPLHRFQALLGCAAVLVAAFVLAYLFVPPVQELAQTIIRVATNRGVLEIETEDEDLEITVKQAGKDVTTAVVIDKKTKRTFELTAEDGQIVAKVPGSDLRLRTTDFTLERGGKTYLKARALLAPAPPVITDERLQGTWRVAAGTSDGKPLTADELAKFQLSFVKDRVVAKVPPYISGRAFFDEGHGTFVVLQGKDKKILQVKPVMTWALGEMGTYELSGDKLLLELDPPIGGGRRLRLELVRESRSGTESETSDPKAVAESLRQIAIAMHKYHDTHLAFPRPTSRDKAGNPLLSWRVHLLPYLDQGDLYRQFKLDEPWDSPHNSKLIVKIPAVYALGASDGKTPLVVPVGKDTTFPGDVDVNMLQFTNGTSNTILVVEAAPAQRVIWTKPDDWAVNPYQPIQSLPAEFMVARMDGAVCRLSCKLPAKLLSNMLSRSGSVVPRDVWQSGEPPKLVNFGTLKHARADKVAAALTKWHQDSPWNRPDITFQVVSNMPQNTLQVTCSAVLVPHVRKLVDWLKKEAAGDPEVFQGRWTLILGELDGKPLPADKLPKLDIRFRGNEYEIIGPGGESMKGTYTIDPDKKQIHLQPRDEKGGDRCSFELKGDRLTLKMDARTLGSTPPGGDSTMRLTFERAGPPN